MLNKKKTKADIYYVNILLSFKWKLINKVLHKTDDV